MPRVVPGETTPVPPGTTYFRLQLNGEEPSGDDRFYVARTATWGNASFTVGTNTGVVYAGVDTTTTSSISLNYGVTYTWTGTDAPRRAAPGEVGMWQLAHPGDRSYAEDDVARAARVAENERQVQRRAARQAAQRAQREAATERARELLLVLLDAEQREQYALDRAFMVRGSAGGMYRIEYGTAGNIKLCAGAHNEAVVQYCGHPDDVDDLPTEDVQVAQMLALQTDEPGFIAACNVHWDHRDRAARADAADAELGRMAERVVRATEARRGPRPVPHADRVPLIDRQIADELRVTAV